MKVEVGVLGVHNSPHGLCGRKATLKNRAQELEVAVLGSQSLIILIASVDVKATLKNRAQELEVAVLGSQSLIVLTVSVDVKQH